MEKEVNAKWREALKDFECHLESETMPSTCRLHCMEEEVNAKWREKL
jgi:hypothetical protein